MIYTENKDFSFIKVGYIEDFPPGLGRTVDVAGQRVALFNVKGELFALRDRCSHSQSPLSEGRIKECGVLCPRHGALFDLRTGEVLSADSIKDVETYEVRVDGDEVYVSVESVNESPLWVRKGECGQGGPAGESGRCEVGGCKPPKRNGPGLLSP